mmetsp:Transcript_48388/g.127755  ORF Transcript_48388/g.127755 Transcript_48388/m.127755 type:complete len:200 (-) Transcript_48388:111-710(-)
MGQLRGLVRLCAGGPKLERAIASRGLPASPAVATTPTSGEQPTVVSEFLFSRVGKFLGPTTGCARHWCRPDRRHAHLHRRAPALLGRRPRLPKRGRALHRFVAQVRVARRRAGEWHCALFRLEPVCCIDEGRRSIPGGVGEGRSPRILVILGSWRAVPALAPCSSRQQCRGAAREMAERNIQHDTSICQIVAACLLVGR